MKIFLKVGALLTVSLLTPVLFGCGSGSGATSTTQGNGTGLNDGASRGALTMQINFPSGKSVKTGRKNGRSRVTGFSNGNIPEGTQAVKVEVVTTSSPETSLALPQVITPSSGQTGGVTGPITVRFTNLPVGNVRVRATAYPDSPAKLTPTAIGNSDVAITTNATATANVTLNLTIDHIAITPTTFTLNFSGINSQTLVATPMTQDNKPLLMPLVISTDRPDVARGSNSTPPPNSPAETSAFLVQTFFPTSATVPATVTVTIAEPNSGKTATASANVIDTFE